MILDAQPRRVRDRGTAAGVNPSPPPPPPPGQDAEQEGGEHPTPPPPKKITRFHGTVAVDPLRAGCDAGRIAEEVTKNLSGLVSANVQRTLEVQAEVPERIPEVQSP